MTTNNTMKVLYFEGAGWEGAELSKATVGNCRIRTAFHLDNGEAVYLELNGCFPMKHYAKELQKFSAVGFVDHLHYITDENPNDDCNKHRLPQERNGAIEYSEQGILNFVNSLGASFDAVLVLPVLSPYRVHGDYTNGNSRYNYGDDFIPNWEVINRAAEIEKYFYELEKAEGKKFPNCSIYFNDNTTSVYILRHFNGYNRKWVVDASCANWLETMQEIQIKKN